MRVNLGTLISKNSAITAIFLALIFFSISAPGAPVHKGVRWEYNVHDKTWSDTGQECSFEIRSDFYRFQRRHNSDEQYGFDYRLSGISSEQTSWRGFSKFPLGVAFNFSRDLRENGVYFDEEDFFMLRGLGPRGEVVVYFMKPEDIHSSRGNEAQYLLDFPVEDLEVQAVYSSKPTLSRGYFGGDGYSYRSACIMDGGNP